MESKPLRIALFSDSAFPVINGVSVSVDQLSRELRNRGHSVHLFAPAFWNHKDEDPHTYRFMSLQTPITDGYPIALPPFAYWYPRFHQIQAEIIHTHTPWLCGLIGLQWGRLRGIPVVSTYHTHYDRYAHYVPAVPERLTRRAIWNHTHRYYNRVDQILTPSESAKKWLLRHRVHKPISIVPTGIPVSTGYDRTELRRLHGIAPNQKIMLYVGRLAKEKNLETLLAAAKTVMQKVPEARLWIVGDGPHRDPCEELARQLGIANQVKFVGYVERDKVNDYYALADVFTFASTTETQGLVVVEAMTHGLPPVVVKGGGASLVIEDGVNGVICANHPDHLAQSILSLLTNDEFRERITQSAIESAEQYGVGAMADAVLNIYNAALQGQKPLGV